MYKIKNIKQRKEKKLLYGYIRNLTQEVKNPIVKMEVADYGTVKKGEKLSRSKVY